MPVQRGQPRRRVGETSAEYTRRYLDFLHSRGTTLPQLQTGRPIDLSDLSTVPRATSRREQPRHITEGELTVDETVGNYDLISILHDATFGLVQVVDKIQKKGLSYLNGREVVLNEAEVKDLTSIIKAIHDAVLYIDRDNSRWTLNIGDSSRLTRTREGLSVGHDFQFGDLIRHKAGPCEYSVTTRDAVLRVLVGVGETASIKNSHRILTVVLQHNTERRYIGAVEWVNPSFFEIYRGEVIAHEQ